MFVSVVVRYYLPLMLNFTQFVSVEGKYFDGAFYFVYCTSIFAFLGMSVAYRYYGCGILR